MNTITQDMRWKQMICDYALKHGVTKAAIRYRTNRQFVYRQLHKYDGSLKSLALLSRRPHNHPNQHKDSELKLIKDMRRRNPTTGLVEFWIRMRRKGYKRSVTSLYRVMRRLGMYEKKKVKPKYVSKPYMQMTYPGERVQVDVKYVPTKCLVGDMARSRLYQYTAIDEYSRVRCLAFYEEKNTYTSTLFLEKIRKYYPFEIKEIRTDNGFEFTGKMSNRKTNTLFERKLSEYGIKHNRIRVATPRHNGKVERSHRTDNERFYSKHKFYSIKDAREQLSRYMRVSNGFPMRPLKWMTPYEVLKDFLVHNVTYVT